MTDRRTSALRHERHYTLAEASGLRGWLAERIARVRGAIDDLSEPEAQAALDSLEPESGGGWPGYEVASAVMTLLGALSEIDAKDIVLRDAERGLVDFPSMRDGEEVYLCWLVDEDEIGWWHRHDDGFAGREPISE